MANFNWDLMSIAETYMMIGSILCIENWKSKKFDYNAFSCYKFLKKCKKSLCATLCNFYTFRTTKSQWNICMKQSPLNQFFVLKLIFTILQHRRNYNGFFVVGKILLKLEKHFQISLFHCERKAIYVRFFYVFLGDRFYM